MTCVGGVAMLLLSAVGLAASDGNTGTDTSLLAWICGVLIAVAAVDYRLARSGGGSRWAASLVAFGAAVTIFVVPPVLLFALIWLASL